SNGDVLLRKHAGGAVQSLRQIRAPKGAPDAGNSSALAGYSFDEDGDTGMFAEGGVSVGSSDLVFRVDGGEAGRIKALMKSSAKNGWGRLLNGQIMQWCEFSVKHVAGAAVGWNLTFPTSFPVRVMQSVISIGNGIGATSLSCSVEGLSLSGASGYVYSNDDTTRIYRLLVIGE
ncbi:phage tail protein, partial [Pseudomonas sp. MF6747]|nr:phage tail protein [Pseudomonas sp. MF6747]